MCVDGFDLASNGSAFSFCNSCKLVLTSSRSLVSIMPQIRKHIELDNQKKIGKTARVDLTTENSLDE